MTGTRSASTSAERLPPGYHARNPGEPDVAAITEILRAAEAAEYGDSDATVEDAERYLSSVDLSADAWLVSDSHEAPAGFIFFDATRERWWGFGSVHPRHRGRGVGAWLLSTAESRARERLRASPGHGAVELSFGALARDADARSLIERAGYRWKRRFWDMWIDLDREPEAPAWPGGIDVRTFTPNQARAVFEAAEEAFEDHFDHTPHRFDDWRRRWLDHPDFDPSLWFVAMDGAEIAGFSLCRQRRGSGWVDVLGVRRPWRRQGLGLALLRHSFRE